MLSEPARSRRKKTLQMRLLELSGTGLESVPVNPSLDSSWSPTVRKGTGIRGGIALETRNVVGAVLSGRRFASVTLGG